MKAEKELSLDRVPSGRFDSWLEFQVLFRKKFEIALNLQPLNRHNNRILNFLAFL